MWKFSKGQNHDYDNHRAVGYIIIHVFFTRKKGYLCIYTNIFYGFNAVSRITYCSKKKKCRRIHVTAAWLLYTRTCIWKACLHTVAYLGGGGRWCDRPPPLWRGLCWRRSGAAPPPPLAVIRGAVGGVWLVFWGGLRREVEKMWKVTKKKVVKFFSDGNFGGWSAS
jgi:hypothetical protein